MRNKTYRSVHDVFQDDLWTLAKYDVMCERNYNAVRDEYTSKQIAAMKELRSIVLNDRELDYTYSGILECEFENYDADH